MTFSESIRKLTGPIEERASKSSLSPWAVRPGDFVAFIGEQKFSVIGGAVVPDGDRDHVCGPQVDLENADFIAHARQDIPALIARLHEMAEALDEARDALEESRRFTANVNAMWRDKAAPTVGDENLYESTYEKGLKAQRAINALAKKLEQTHE